MVIPCDHVPGSWGFYKQSPRPFNPNLVSHHEVCQVKVVLNIYRIKLSLSKYQYMILYTTMHNTAK